MPGFSWCPMKIHGCPLCLFQYKKAEEAEGPYFTTALQIALVKLDAFYQLLGQAELSANSEDSPLVASASLGHSWMNWVFGNWLLNLISGYFFPTTNLQKWVLFPNSHKLLDDKRICFPLHPLSSGYELTADATSSSGHHRPCNVSFPPA